MNPEKNTVKVLITDDHALFRAGVKASLAHYSDLEFIGEAENGMEMLHLVKTLKPDVILLDIQMPIMDGIAALPEVRKILPKARIIMLTMNDDVTMISRLMEIGANSYLLKNSDSQTIYEAIKTVFNNEFYFNEYTNKAMLNGLRSRRNQQTIVVDNAELTDKEMYVLKLMCDEKSTREIAELADISPRTVEAIRDRLKLKTGARSTAGLVLYAVKHGLVAG